MSDRRYPAGRISPEDDGEVEIRVGIQHGRVIVAFPKEVSWFGLTVEAGDELIDMLTKRVAELRAMEP